MKYHRDGNHAGNFRTGIITAFEDVVGVFFYLAHTLRVLGIAGQLCLVGLHGSTLADFLLGLYRTHHERQNGPQ